MFGTFPLMAFVASVSVLVARADPTPTVPGPGTVYKEGTPCRTEWTGDTASPSSWQDMTIELMTGDNFNMTHLMTVKTGLDGTKNGNFEFPCPPVDPHSAIYFFQFSATGAQSKQWATRFAIASPNGETTPPSEPTQPGTNEPIPWGRGALVNPPPEASPPNSGASNSTCTTTTTSNASPQSVAGHLDPTPTATTTSRFSTVFVSSTSSAAPTPTSGSIKATKDNAAMAVTIDSHVWQVAVALSMSAMAFMALL